MKPTWRSAGPTRTCPRRGIGCHPAQECCGAVGAFRQRRRQKRESENQGGSPTSDGRRVGCLGRTAVNVTLLKVILSESGLNPTRLRSRGFSVAQINDMVKDPSIDAFMTVGPLDSRITTDAIATTARLRGEPVFIPIDVSEAISHKHPLYESEEIPAALFTSAPARPEDKVETLGVDHLIVAPKSLSRHDCSGTFTAGAVCGTAAALVREDRAASNASEAGPPTRTLGDPGTSWVQRPISTVTSGPSSTSTRRLLLGCHPADVGARLDRRVATSLREAR